jgi:phenylacetaldehyde dehydrogenase
MASQRVDGLQMTPAAHARGVAGRQVAFTGSTEVRRLIVQAANDLKKLTLELGGKSPNIILDDAISTSRFRHRQRLLQPWPVLCAGSRLFVRRGVRPRRRSVANIARNIKTN